MPQSGIHAALSFQLGKFTRIKEKFLPSIVFGAILPDIDYIAVILGLIYYPINLSQNLFHRTFSHSFFTLIIIYLFFSFISELKKNNNIKQIGLGITIGMLSHIILDTLVSFQNIHLLWPLPLEGFKLWDVMLLPNWILKIGYISEFFFFSCYAWFLIKYNIANPNNNSWTIKYLNYWRKLETLLTIIFTFLALINYSHFKILFILAFIPSILLSLYFTYLNFEVLKYKLDK